MPMAVDGEAQDLVEAYSSHDADILFNDSLLRELDCSKCSFASHGLSYARPGPGLAARPLARGDFDKGYLSLLSQLTTVGDYTRNRFESQFDAMRKNLGTHFVVVVEDTRCGKMVANATLLVERKFIHKAALRGRIEDVVVDKDYRNLRLGTFLVELLTVLSQTLGCYKTTLDCKPDISGYYQKLGYVSEGQLLMSQRHFD